MTESNVELARRGFEAALSGDLDAIREFLDPEVKWHGGDPSAAGACHNREQALEFMRRARNRRRVGEVIDVVDAGDKVVVIIRSPSEDGEQAALSATRSVAAKPSRWCITRTPRTRLPPRVSKGCRAREPCSVGVVEIGADGSA
jgi:hypothetical protein